MTIDEAINFVENMIYNYRPYGEQLKDWRKLLNLLRWYKEQDLIPRQSIIDVLKTHCEEVDTELCIGGDCTVCEIKRINTIPKAEYQ